MTSESHGAIPLMPKGTGPLAHSHMDSLPDTLTAPDFSVLREVTLDPLPPPTTVFIYVLTDPRTNAVRYVGQARDPRKRLSEHCSESYPHSPNGKYAWVGELKEAGLIPRMFLLESVPAAMGDEREAAWAGYFRERGDDLVNYRHRRSMGNNRHRIFDRSRRG